MNFLFTQQIRIYRKVRMPDGQGGWDETDSLITTTRGRMRPLTTRELLAGGLDIGIDAMRVYLPKLAVQRGDIIDVSDTPLKKAYRVISVRDPSSLGHHLEIDAESVAL